ncbi:transitional endoplasmic reticulum ATPase 1 [Podospora aff. communis PSN243]|uniref:Transitional endoplasmic reticulum ATPase 1 n=1 Tax=Podospora aff. communis PSN243 TaxID=3040156 RepID=A0AAV9GGK7_9PEZI|nr:transitional endoplasmic reticulum ATPase 1 [Podospora aff. communis PSN243]
MASPDATDLASKEAALHQKYIELLEKRVAQLETVVKQGDEKPKAADVGGEKSEANKEKEAKEKEEKAEAENGGRYRNILRRWDKNAGSHVDQVVSANFFLKPQTKDVAYTFRRVYDPDTGDKGAYSALDIEDPALIRVLKQEIGKYPGVNFDSDITSMRGPFAALVHNWDKLNKRAAVEPESQVSKDLVSLLERVKTAPELQDYFKSRDSNLAAKVVTFDTLWANFAPGTLVVARLFQNVEQIFKVEDSPIPWSTYHSYRHHKMWAWSWDFDGKKILKVEYALKFERFRGTKPITELPFYPLEYHADPERLKEESRARALKFIKATIRCARGAEQMFRYKGLAYADQRNLLSNKDDKLALEDEALDIRPQEDEELPQPKLVDINGEVLVDPDAFIQYGTSYPPLGELYQPEAVYIDELQTNTEDYVEFAEKVKKMDLHKPLDTADDNFVIFPPRVLGYATREKVWGQFGLHLMSDRPDRQPDKFDDNLQLDAKYKSLIKALVQSHEQAAEHHGKQVEDVVRDKGKGLVLLLHGPPGVGKTLTAETIAQATAKPLVVVSVAEIGLDASRAERNLERLFKLATKWEAILLVDEADVFLETRGSTSSASRNALVSVLLRVLEYYRGIIILTTNRIKSIDVAVISRIHLAIRYDDLSVDQMRSIFKYFLDQLEPGCIANRESIDDFIESFGHHYNLNGRQIRNVVSAALAAARHEAKAGGKDGRMTFKHLKSVCEMTRDFQEQLKENTRQQRYNNEAMRP